MGLGDDHGRADPRVGRIILLIGVPLGILVSPAGVRALERRSRVVLDAMQVMPTFCYLLPSILLFDIGYPPAVIATVIFALPAAIRLTAARPPGRARPAASRSAPRTARRTRQSLWKIQMPVARPALLLGVNQTINLALGVVVIAALVGAGGLGPGRARRLQNVDVGQAFDAGLAIVAVAIVLDRLTAGRSVRAARAFRRARTPERMRGSSCSIGLAIVARRGDPRQALVVGRCSPRRSTSRSATRQRHRRVVSRQSPHRCADHRRHRRRSATSWSSTCSNPIRDFLVDRPWWVVVVRIHRDRLGDRGPAGRG